MKLLSFVDFIGYWVARSDGNVSNLTAVYFALSTITSALTDFRNEFQSLTDGVNRGDISVTI
jgi:hypothetical protein